MGSTDVPRGARTDNDIVTDTDLSTVEDVIVRRLGERGLLPLFEPLKNHISIARRNGRGYGPLGDTLWAYAYYKAECGEERLQIRCRNKMTGRLWIAILFESSVGDDTVVTTEIRRLWHGAPPGPQYSKLAPDIRAREIARYHESKIPKAVSRTRIEVLVGVLMWVLVVVTLVLPPVIAAGNLAGTNEPGGTIIENATRLWAAVIWFDLVVFISAKVWYKRSSAHKELMLFKAAGPDDSKGVELRIGAARLRSLHQLAVDWADRRYVFGESEYGFLLATCGTNKRGQCRGLDSNGDWLSSAACAFLPGLEPTWENLLTSGAPRITAGTIKLIGLRHRSEIEDEIYSMMELLTSRDMVQIDRAEQTAAILFGVWRERPPWWSVSDNGQARLSQAERSQRGALRPSRRKKSFLIERVNEHASPEQRSNLERWLLLVLKDDADENVCAASAHGELALHFASGPGDDTDWTWDADGEGNDGTGQLGRRGDEPRLHIDSSGNYCLQVGVMRAVIQNAVPWSIVAVNLIIAPASVIAAEHLVSSSNSARPLLAIRLDSLGLAAAVLAASNLLFELVWGDQRKCYHSIRGRMRGASAREAWKWMKILRPQGNSKWFGAAITPALSLAQVFGSYSVSNDGNCEVVTANGRSGSGLEKVVHLRIVDVRDVGGLGGRIRNLTGSGFVRVVEQEGNMHKVGHLMSVPGWAYVVWKERKVGHVTTAQRTREEELGKYAGRKRKSSSRFS